MVRVTAALVALSLISCRTMPQQETGFLNRTGYSVYVPHDFDRSKQWPVILFLHGAGERGTDGLKSTQVGIGSAIRFGADRIPAIVVFPQAPPETRWLEQPADAAITALDCAIAEFNGDPDRVYLTGLSMGGYGAWHLAMANPNRFAALVVVCGGLLPHETAISVRQSPLTMGAADPIRIHCEEAATPPHPHLSRCRRRSGSAGREPADG